MHDRLGALGHACDGLDVREVGLLVAHAGAHGVGRRRVLEARDDDLVVAAQLLDDPAPEAPAAAGDE